MLNKFEFVSYHSIEKFILCRLKLSCNDGIVRQMRLFVGLCFLMLLVLCLSLILLVRMINLLLKIIYKTPDHVLKNNFKIEWDYLIIII